MLTCDTIEQIRAAVRSARQAGRSVGVVPTMGALHVGHTSLIDAAVKDGHFVIATIFVNPTQFAPNEDMDAYPRKPRADLELCATHGADAVFMPSTDQMYPSGAATTVSVAGLSGNLCGRSRDGHFDGVCTVVSKLFNIVQPDAAYFGQKDAQQTAVIRRMTVDLDFPIRIVVCPIVREPDGLAMSSRNVNLSPEERAQAPALYQSLQAAARLIGQGEKDARRVAQAMEAFLLERASLGQVDYVEIVNPDTLGIVNTIGGPALIALAVKFSRARLIDNLVVDAPGAPV